MYHFTAHKIGYVWIILDIFDYFGYILIYCWYIFGITFVYYWYIFLYIFCISLVTFWGFGIFHLKVTDEVVRSAVQMCLDLTGVCLNGACITSASFNIVGPGSAGPFFSTCAMVGTDICVMHLCLGIAVFLVIIVRAFYTILRHFATIYSIL